MQRATKDKFFDITLFIPFFFGLGGYYFILILVTNLASNAVSRFFTVPLRIVIILSFFYLFKKSITTKRINNLGKIFLLFCFLYLFRIGLEYFGHTKFYMSLNSFLMYFLSFVLIPFYFLSKIRFTNLDYNKMFYYVLLGSLGVAILTIFFYGKLIGQVSRISHIISKDENYISPLALS